jgi:NitT/TauT family transport system substrate-binding protein
MIQDRRRFLGILSSAGAAGLIGAGNSFAEAAPLETTRLRLVQTPSICQAAQFTAEDLLRREGFADVQYIKKPGTQGIETALASGEADIAMHFNVRLIIRVEAGDPIVILAGGHLGCFELKG